jgi:hypothetical protein
MDLKPINPQSPAPVGGSTPGSPGGAPPLDASVSQPDAAPATSQPDAAPAPPVTGAQPWSMNDVPPAAPQPGAAPPAHMPASAIPEADNTAPTPINLPVSPQHKRKKTKLVALIIVLVILVLGLGSAAAYVGYYLPNKPDNILGQALLNSFSKDLVKSASFEGKVSATDKDGKAISGSGTYKGIVDQKGAFDITATVDVVLTKLTFDARSVDGKSYYLRVDGLDGLAALLSSSGGAAAAYAPIIAVVEDQWFEISESVLKQYSGGTYNTTLSDADRQKIVDAYGGSPFFVVTETLASESIKGVDSHHYKVGFDKTKLKAFAVALKNAKLDSLKLSDDDIKSFNKSVDSGDSSKFVVDVWIDKTAKLFKQFQVNATENGQKVTMTLTIEDYNKPLNVEKPADAKSILELLSAFLGGAGPDYTMPDQETLLQQVQGLTL